MFNCLRIPKPLVLLATAIFSAVRISNAAQPDPTPAASVKMDINWLDVRGINQPVLPDQTVVQVVYKLNGMEVNSVILVDADTYIWKGVDRNKGSENNLVLRDGSFSRALLRLNLDSLPKGAEITSATFRFLAQGVERKGEPGNFYCHRMITPWTEAATWFRPQPSASNWDGLRAGRDFDRGAFAKLEMTPLDEPKKTGYPIVISGFSEMLKQWQGGTVPNNGFLLTFNSKALQVVIPSRENALQSRTLVLGGTANSKILFVPNLSQLDRILLKASDLESAQPWLSIAQKAKGNTTTGELKLYDCEETNPVPGKLLASIPFQDIPQGPFQLPELLPLFHDWLASGNAKHALLATVEGSKGTTAPELIVDGLRSPRKPVLTIKTHKYPSFQLFGTPPVTPRPGVYAQIENGHIYYGGKRLRLWGSIGYPHPDRLLKMGFNAQRIWAPSAGDCYTVETIKTGTFSTYEKGDGSKMDFADKHIAELKSNGLFVMLASLSYPISTDLLTRDDSFIAGGEDWNAWKEAVRMKGVPLQHVIFVDERLQKARMTHAKNLLTHLNPYTGKAYGEEECIAIYEVFNENAFMDKIVNGGLQNWPPYFKTKLQNKWNEWLQKRYANDAALLKSWGSLTKDESLDKRTVQPGPDFESRVRFPEKRSADYVEFLIELENKFNQDFRAYCRSLFPKGTGVNVAPFSFDTLFRPNIPWSYTQSLGDVNCPGMYFWDSESTLSKPPSAYVMDSFTTAGMPTVIYETNAGRPCPYRSEYPIKLAAIASRQDWDGVFWHYWSKGGGDDDVEYLAGTLGYPNIQHYWTAVYNELDPVMCSALAMGGHIFLDGQLPPAENPAIFKVGKKALFSYENIRGINTAAATFSKGSRIVYEPNEDGGITLDGKEMPVIGRMTKALAAGEHVTWDWPNERLIIDTPTVKSYVGKTNGKFCFRDGIALDKVNSPWICFTITSADGKPLCGSDASHRILMTGVFDAKMDGFIFDYKTRGGPVEQSRGIANVGHEPVLVDKVEYQVTFPNALNGVLKCYDFALREISHTPLSNSSEVIQKGATPFMDVLEIKERSAKSTAAGIEPTKIETTDYAGLIADSGSTGAISASEGAGAVYPVAGLHWEMDYTASRQFLQDAPLVYTSMSKDDGTAVGDKTITLTDAKLPLLWNSLADIVISFHAGAMSAVEVTFKQPPSIEEVVFQFSKILGQPVQKKIDAQFGTTEIRWNSQKQLPGVYVTESQGIMKIIYQPGSQTESNVHNRSYETN